MILPFTEKEASTFKKEGGSSRPKRVEEKMKRCAVEILAGLLLLCPFLQAQGKPISSVVNLSGGVSVSTFRETGTESGTDTSKKIEDAVLEISVSRKGADFDLSLGSLLLPTVLNSTKQENKGNFGLNRNGDRFGLLWGYLELKPAGKLNLKVGVLPTNVGYELAESYKNFNITYGLVWNSQPFIYRGVRATYTFGKSLQIYGEYDRGKELNGNDRDHAFGIGAAGAIGELYYTVNYFDYGNYKNLFDFTLSTECKKVKLGFNGDYQWLDRDKNKAGYGLAFYVVPDLGRISLPVRVEYVKDINQSGIYGFNDRGTYSFTVTPTYKLSEHTTVRAEYSYVKSNYSKAFNGSDHKEILSFQFSYAF